MMKNRKVVILLLTGFIATTPLFGQKLKPAQNPNYGADSVARMECASNLSTMSEFVKIKVYEYAYDPWKYCFYNCPQASKSIYIRGKKILDYKIDNAETPEDQQAFVDTLMMMYDQRIEYFGENGKVLGKKGIDLLKYRRSAVVEARGYLKESLELDGIKADASVAATFVTASAAMFKNGMIEADEMISGYLLAMQSLEGMRQNTKTKMATESVEKTFAESGAADCDALIAIFTPKYETGSQDIELLKKITDLLSQTNCQESDLFAQAAESLYSLEPSAKSGANLALTFASRGEYEKANEYYLKAIEQETDDERKAGYYYQLGAIAMKNKQYQKVKNYVTSAIQLKADYGKAYILIGNAYAASSPNCGASDFEKAAVYLAAVDKFSKAKNVDPSVAEEATQLVSRYKQYFPNKEDAFFEGYTDGQAYTIKCWINESTKIRTRSN